MADRPPRRRPWRVPGRAGGYAPVQRKHDGQQRQQRACMAKPRERQALFQLPPPNLLPRVRENFFDDSYLQKTETARRSSGLLFRRRRQ